MEDYIERFYDQEEFFATLSETGLIDISVTREHDGEEPGPFDPMIFECGKP